MDISFLKKIFPNKTFPMLGHLHGGMMNHSLIIEDEEKIKYVLYIPTEQANEMVNRYLEKENQQIAISLGVTSSNIYFDPETGIKINKYIPGDSLNNIDEYDVKKIAVLLNKIHASKSLSKKDYLPFDRLNAFINERKALTDDDTRKIRHDKLLELVFHQRTFLESGNLVLSHNDFQKSNIVKSDDNHYYVIDFEFMMNNYELYDIACLGNDNVKEGYELLKAIYKNNLNKDIEKGFFLWRIFISLQWYNVALIKHIRGEGKIHNIDFNLVTEHFLKNAEEAYKNYLEL